MESTKAIPWKINWKTKQFDYVGPQITNLLGWPPESWLSVNDWVNRMHPEDRQAILSFCISLSQEGIDHETEYRLLTQDGNYVWVRDIAHVVREENGNIGSLVGLMFDISNRKNSESISKISTNILIAAFKLTPSECRMAILLSEGLDQKEIARKLGLKHDTVRKQLQIIYQKTATNQQSQLIRLMLQLPSRFIQEP